MMQVFGTRHLVSFGVAIACALATPAQAQNDKMTPIATPEQPNAIVLGTGPCPAQRRPRHGTVNMEAPSPAT